MAKKRSSSHKAYCPYSCNEHCELILPTVGALDSAVLSSAVVMLRSQISSILKKIFP